MLSDDELEILKKYKLSGCKSLRQFIMKCILEKDIFVLDIDVFRDMSTNISRISSNINQIAKMVNSSNVIYKNDIDDLKTLLTKQWKEILDMRIKIYSFGNLETYRTEDK